MCTNVVRRFSKKTRIHTKIHGMYLDLPESLLEEKKPEQSSNLAVTEETTDSVEPQAPFEKSIIDQITEEVQSQKKQKMYVFHAQVLVVYTSSNTSIVQKLHRQSSLIVTR